MITSPTVPLRRSRGFSLIELMVAIAISLGLIAAMATMLVNVSNNNNEMAKANAQIENGRFAIQALEMDIVQAGYWGTFVPQFDDMNWKGIPADKPTAIPNPCLAYTATSWDFAYVNNLVGLPLVVTDTLPAGCTLLGNQVPNTAVLLVRHAESCVAGAVGCDPVTTGKMYFQSSLCATATGGTARSTGNSATTIGLPAPISSNTISGINNAYAGMLIHTVGGTGAGQTRTITAFSNATNNATVSPVWTTTPNDTTVFTITENIVSTSGFTHHVRGANCGTAAAAPLRKLVSNIYYVRDFSVTAGDGIPTLVRSSFDPTGPAALTHQAPVALVEGIENFQVDVGLDNLVTRCSPSTAVNYDAEPSLVSPATCTVNTVDRSLNTLPRNRGDGSPDEYVRCNTATPCSAAQLANAVAVKLHVLVRNTTSSPGYTDTKTYCLGENLSGGCPTNRRVGPFSDGFQRHLFSTTVRLPSVAGRRETP